MDQTNDNLGQDEVVETEPVAKEEGEPKSTDEELGSVDQSQLLLGLMADEDVQQILSARRQGLRSKVVIEPSEEPPAEPEPEFEIESDDPEITAAGKKIMELLESRLKPLTEDVGTLKELAAGLQQTRVDDQITKAKEKYSDFDGYRSIMSKMSREAPGLGVEELYLLAKFRDGKVNPAPPSTHTEKPSPTPRGRMKVDVPERAMSPRRKFQQTLADALERTVP